MTEPVEGVERNVFINPDPDIVVSGQEPLPGMEDYNYPTTLVVSVYSIPDKTADLVIEAVQSVIGSYYRMEIRRGN